MEPPNYSIENPNPINNNINNNNINDDDDNNNLPPSYEESVINIIEDNQNIIINDIIDNQLNDINNEIELYNIYSLNNLINILNLLVLLNSFYYIFVNLDFFIIFIITILVSYWFITKYNVFGYLLLFSYTIFDLTLKFTLIENNDNLFYGYITVMIIVYLFIYYYSCRIISLLWNTSNENLILLRQGYTP